MEVYLVPIGRGRHALYCERGDDPHPVEPPPGRGFWKKLTDKFTAVIDAVEREHDGGHGEHDGGHGEHDGGHGEHDGRPRPGGLWPRLRARAMAWMAEKIAEQRLLWRLRGKTKVCAWIPTGLDREHALATIRGNLVADFDRHRWWMVVDSLGGVFSIALMFIPGPNLIGYYFAFRIVGHLLSMRGARHGLTSVQWDLEPSEPLAELEGIDALPQPERERRVQSVAGRLGLRRFARFYRRAAPQAA